MPSADYGPVFRQVNRLFGGGTNAGMDERLLLERFCPTGTRRPSRRWSPGSGRWSWGSAGDGLADPHDVEDAFQATFLILVRKAATIRDGDLLATGSYGVALPGGRPAATTPCAGASRGDRVGSRRPRPPPAGGTSRTGSS